MFRNIASIDAPDVSGLRAPLRAVRIVGRSNGVET